MKSKSLPVSRQKPNERQTDQSVDLRLRNVIPEKSLFY